jgi:hypothetical protein
MVNKGRAALAAGMIAAAVALVLGFSSAPASATTTGTTHIVIVSKSPSQPTAGQKFTVKFQLQKAGVAQPISSVGCFAAIGGRAVPVIHQDTDGITGRCAWAIPSGTSGRMLDGVITTVHRDTGTRYFLGFDVPIR